MLGRRTFTRALIAHVLLVCDCPEVCFAIVQAVAVDVVNLGCARGHLAKNDSVHL
jgi:hypothetical protein